MDSISKAWDEIFYGDENGFSLENIDLSTFDSIKSELDNMADELKLDIDYSSFDNFVSVLNDTSSTEKQVEDAFISLASSIVSAGVNGNESFELLKQTLQELGVENFEVVALQELTKNTEALRDAGLDLANATYEEIEAFVNETLVLNDASISAENASEMKP